MLTFGSLFSGIGGLDLGLERAGWRCLWQSEIDPYASRVLAKHWPDVPNLGDVKQIEWNTVERPDLIAGGYPCQPFSFAGHVKLWPTPIARDSRSFKGAKRAPNALGSEPLVVQVGGALNPTWVEWLMGFPLGWTDCEDSAMPSSPKSQSGSDAD